MKIKKVISAALVVCFLTASVFVDVGAEGTGEDEEGLVEVREEADGDEAVLMQGDKLAEEETSGEEEEDPEEADASLEETAEEEEIEDGDDDPGKGRLAGYIPDEFYGSGSSGISTFSISNNDVTHASRFSSGYTIEQGIDVSKWDGSIDWAKVKKAGVDFAIIRVAYRGYGSAGTLCEDNYAKTNVKGAVDAGIPIGIYIFSQATTSAEAKEEADYVIRLAEGYNAKITLPVVMDFEYYSDGGNGSEGRLYNANLSKSAATTVCNAFCSEVKAKGYDPMVYANKSMLSSKLNASSINGKIWLAHYTKATDYSGDYEYWQYSSSGSVSGINAKVDMNYRYVKNGSTTTTSSASTSSSSSSSSKTYTKYKTTTRVNYRTGAGTSYKVAGTLSSGKEIEVEDGYSKSANGYTWKRFKMNGTNYYIASKYITKATSTSSSSSSISSSSSSSAKTYNTYKTTTRVNYRSGAGTSKSIKGTLKKNTSIQVEKGYSKKANGYTWYRFKKSGKNYYIASKYVKKSSSSSSSSKTYNTYKTTTRVNYRSGAGTSKSVKGTLKKGTKIQVEKGYSKKANGYTWYRFKKSGKNYYIASKYIKKA